MRALLLILLLTVSAQAQQLEDIKDWKLIKEMSGEIPDHPGLTIEMYAAQIARGDSRVKLIVKAEFPGGAPRDLLKDHVPHGFDASSISTMVFKVEFDCDTLTVKAVNNSGEIYQFNGKRYKSKEPPFTIESGHILSQYFCERGTAPTKAPVLKP